MTTNLKIDKYKIEEFYLCGPRCLDPNVPAYIIMEEYCMLMCLDGAESDV